MPQAGERRGQKYPQGHRQQVAPDGLPQVQGSLQGGARLCPQSPQKLPGTRGARVLPIQLVLRGAAL